MDWERRNNNRDREGWRTDTTKEDRVRDESESKLEAGRERMERHGETIKR